MGTEVVTEVPEPEAVAAEPEITSEAVESKVEEVDTPTEEPKESKLGSSRFEQLNTVEDIIETPIEEIPKEMVKEAISDPQTPEQKEAAAAAPAHEEPQETKKEEKVGL